MSVTVYCNAEDRQDVPVYAWCDRCGGEVYGEDWCHYIGGQVICEDCLMEYARSYFLPCRLRARDLGKGWMQ